MHLTAATFVLSTTQSAARINVRCEELQELGAADGGRRKGSDTVTGRGTASTPTGA
jgi:hypothetical protein